MVLITCTQRQKSKPNFITHTITKVSIKMRVRLGGAVVDLHCKTRHVVLAVVLFFIFSTFYVMTNMRDEGLLDKNDDRHRRGFKSLDKDGEYIDDFGEKNPLDDVKEGLLISDVKFEPRIPKDEVKNIKRIPKVNKLPSDNMDKPVRMAMESAKNKQYEIGKMVKEILKGQKRPTDNIFNINVTLSDQISMDRKLPDTRPLVCRKMQYDRSSLPKASVIIPFYNEALSMLIRTVHSILNRSPDDLLNEVILVDDRSTYEYLTNKTHYLDEYFKLLPKVKLIRNTKREGLIESRMVGARVAKGPILIFQDAHTETNEGWLEPLLDELKRHPKSVVQPFVDGIDALNLDFTSPPTYYKGSFSWDLRYTWLRVTDHEMARSIETGYPFFSPTLVGCAIAVDMRYFKEIGGFDEQLKVWGGENIELGFRTWMCGGRVVTVTCSRVGHVFKEFPYKFDGNKEEIVQKNLIRVAETWMDDYKKYFYASTRVYEFKRAELSEDEVHSLQEWRDHRTKLKCHNFEWYMYNIIPELEAPRMDSVYYGEITSLRSQACFEVWEDYYIGLTYYCFFHKIIPKNYFSITTDGMLRYRDRCVKASGPNPSLRLAECPKSQSDYESFGVFTLLNKGHTWGQIQVKQRSDKGVMHTYCLCQVTNALEVHKKEQMPQLAKCDESNEFQKWSFTYKFDWDQVPKPYLVT